jgi:hypothetical protein
MEDVEVYDGIGYFSSDVDGGSGRTGVDIVDLSIPFDPERLNRIDTSDCLSSNPTVCAHGKVHTLAVQRFNQGTPQETRYLYTADNETSVVKISDVTDPSNPHLIQSISLPGVSSNVDAHGVAVRNNRLFIASKDPNKTAEGAGDGWVHIYDVSNPTAPVLLKLFQSGTSVNTAMATDDDKTLIVTEERQDGALKFYDISNINSPNDPDNPVLLKTFKAADVCHNGVCITGTFSPSQLHVHGNLLFVPWYDAGLQVFNITNRANPVLVGAYDTWAGTSDTFNGDWGVDLGMGLNRVLVSDRRRGLLVLDASAVVIPGDYTFDMAVNDLDLQLWRANFGSTHGNPHDAPIADGNYNGVVDSADYVIWRKHFGQVQSGAGVGSAVPEPARAALLLIGCAITLLSRHQRQSGLSGSFVLPKDGAVDAPAS